MSNLSKFFGPNAGYVLELYERYQRDHASVDASTRALFEKATPEDLPEVRHAPSATVRVETVVGAARLGRLTREYGHLAARIDPLGSDPPGDPELEFATHGLTEEDLRGLPPSVVGGPLVGRTSDALEAIRALQALYCGSIGYDFDQIQKPEERVWLRDAVETQQFTKPLGSGEDRELLYRLTMVETFERFLHRSFPTQKWFSIEGLDLLVPMMYEVILNAADAGTREVVIGIAHRGRLNVLAHILGLSYEAVLGGFLHDAERRNGTAASDAQTDGWTGDVTYHLGATRRLAHSGGTTVMPITLVSNPSHLEFVDPVVEGRARAAQETRSNRGPPGQDERASLPLLIHGDAAFPGQGIVAETLNLSRLSGYRTGGTIHIIANNQLGFTTDEADARSTLYASDLAKGFEIPIVHVNADDAEACIAASCLAHAYRERFQKDFLIDLVGYRRYGHNESDEPAYTQPLMYERIAQHPSARERWAKTLIERGTLNSDEAAAMVEQVQERLRAAYQQAIPADEGPSPSQSPDFNDETIEALVPPTTLRELNETLLARPEGFNVNPKLDRALQRRRPAIEKGTIDWGHAESLAFASILADGVPIRFTGQDTERGTFSQRHLALHDAKSGERYCPLQALPQADASFAVHNSPLSENAALGFEYGYSSHAPGTLVLWEAQYGDFANSAQVIIDQFIVSGEAKWRQRCGLVLLLPHGYEGQGPEHSSARLERYLQLAADGNLRVAYPTTAGQYYHLLRRHAALLRVDPRPLVVMTPKSLLRSPRAAASLPDLSDVTFQPVINDRQAQDRGADVHRVIVCSGKIYMDLVASPRHAEARETAIIRIEELSPFPVDQLARVLMGYPLMSEVIWVQEEPRNAGAWPFAEPLLRELLSVGMPLAYVGRPPRASPAEGSVDQHNAEQARIVESALTGEPDLYPQSNLEGVKHVG